MDADEILRELNPPQREAVTQTEGPLLVLAGAGSGKTRVIAHRIAYLLAVKNVHPRNVVAVTFTNKAAEEMRRRVEDLLLPFGVRPPLIATFHSACVRILREHIRHLGISGSFVIYDEDDRLTLVKECLRAEEVDERALPPSQLVHRISQAKNQMLSVEEVERQARTPREERIALIFRRYQSRLAASNALDFDDLLLVTVRLFEKVPDRPRRNHLMKALDRLNARLGAGTVRYAAEGIRKPWAARFDRRSPRYTTRWEEIPRVRC